MENLQYLVDIAIGSYDFMICVAIKLPHSANTALQLLKKFNTVLYIALL